jgi:hypothetical protein
MRQKKFGKDSFGLRPLQPPEITTKPPKLSLEKLGENRRGLEKLGEKAWARLYFDIFAPRGLDARHAYLFTYLDWYSSLQKRQRPARSRNVAALAERVVAVSGARSARWQNGVARKWRRNGLKRLNPRPEMVWALKP